MSYKLSKKADSDFKNIYKYTYKKFGERQADKYTESLEDCFLLISDNQNMGRTANNVSKGLFQHEHQKHIVFYRIKKHHIFIVRIRHNSEDMKQYAE